MGSKPGFPPRPCSDPKHPLPAIPAAAPGGLDPACGSDSAGTPGRETSHGVVDIFCPFFPSCGGMLLSSRRLFNQRCVSLREGNSYYLEIILQPLPDRTTDGLLLQSGKPGRTSPDHKKKARNEGLWHFSSFFSP